MYLNSLFSELSFSSEHSYHVSNNMSLHMTFVGKTYKERPVHIRFEFDESKDLTGCIFFFPFSAHNRKYFFEGKDAKHFCLNLIKKERLKIAMSGYNIIEYIERLH